MSSNLKICFLSAVLFFLSFSAFSKSEQLKSLTIQGDTYANACTQKELSRLKKDFDDLKLSKDSADAWQTIQLILCNEASDQNTHYLAQRTAKTIVSNTDSTGDKPIKKKQTRSLALVKSFFAQGQAWKANVELRENDLLISYLPNEACLRELIFKNTSKKWLITTTSEACD